MENIVVTVFYVLGGLIFGGLVIRIVQALVETRRMRSAKVGALPQKPVSYREAAAVGQIRLPPLPELPTIPEFPPPRVYLEQGVYYVVGQNNSYGHPVGAMLLVSDREIVALDASRSGTSPRSPEADEVFWRNVIQGHLRYMGDIQGQFAEFSRSWNQVSTQMTQSLRDAFRGFDQSLGQLGQLVNRGGGPQWTSITTTLTSPANPSARVEVRDTSRGLNELVVDDDCYYEAAKPLAIFGRGYAAGEVILKEDLVRLSPQVLGEALRDGGIVRRKGAPPTRRSRYERLASDDDLV